MAIELSNSLKEKYEKLQAAIHARSKLIIAYSGGVDSALLAKVAHDQLGDDSWAVLIDSETVPSFELEAGRKLAGEIGINFQSIHITQLEDDDFIANNERRCFYCRNSMARSLKEFASKKGINNIAAGAQSTDLDDYRPGIQAFHDAGIWHPFIEFNFSKSDIRALAKHLELPIHDKPAMACLSSRIPYGEKITEPALEMIANAEEFLRTLGFSQYRARTHGNLIRIEIKIDEVDKLLKNRAAIIKKMKEIGYSYVSVDLEGFRSGSMNEVLELKKSTDDVE
jgi:uncharacterized protein